MRGVAGRIPMGRRGSPFPFALTVPQCTTEGLLQDHLSRLGCKVERGVELVSLEPHSNGAIATVTVGGDPSMLNQREYDWVLGCDGASSVVRRALQVRFGGATSSDVCAIAGDAAHVCAPIGGQGLNSGVGDAVAIVPALVSVMRGHAPDSLLDHVARQRQRAAQRTGRLAWLAASVNSPRSRRVASARDALAPAGVVASRRFVTGWLAGAADR
jgi:2-polyprenyl-6-methoxyphenol hydroxylase-like FAD-dependent oxidoreductase